MTECLFVCVWMMFGRIKHRVRERATQIQCLMAMTAAPVRDDGQVYIGFLCWLGWRIAYAHAPIVRCADGVVGVGADARISG